MDVQNSGYLSIEQLTQQYLAGRKTVGEPKNDRNLSFRQILEQKSAEETAEGLKFSKHALGRLNDRNIELSRGQLERLNDGAKKAGQKGIRESLVIVDQLAFIVNVPSRTVVTAMDSTETTDNVFTNINGAVII